jgi:hypothetical protein
VQRIYVPRLAIAELEIVAVIKAPAPRKAAALLQDDLFASIPMPNSRPN